MLFAFAYKYGIFLMRDFQASNRWRAFFASRAVLSVLLLFLMGVGVMSFRALEAGWEAEAERAAVRERLQELEKKKNALTSELEVLRSEEGIEREARQKLNLHKPGEEVVIIKEANTVPVENDAAHASFWEKVKQWFSRIMNLAYRQAG